MPISFCRPNFASKSKHRKSINDHVQKLKDEYEHETFFYILQDDIYIDTEDEASDGEIDMNDDVDEAPQLHEFRDETGDASIIIKYALDNKTKQVRKLTKVRLGRGRMVDRPINERDKEAREWKDEYEKAACNNTTKRMTHQEICIELEKLGVSYINLIATPYTF